MMIVKKSIILIISRMELIKMLIFTQMIILVMNMESEVKYIFKMNIL